MAQFEQMQRVIHGLQQQIRQIVQERNKIQIEADKIYGAFICVLLQHCNGKTKVLKNTIDTLRPGTMIVNPKDEKFHYFEVAFPTMRKKPPGHCPAPPTDVKPLPDGDKSETEGT